MTDNSWHEKGELPPVGTVCDAWFAGHGWLKVEIIKHGKNDNCACYLISGHINGVNLKWTNNFRPIKSDREKAIEEMMHYRNAKDGFLTWAEFCEALYDAGYRKTQ